MSIFAMLQGSEETDIATTRSALAIGKLLKRPVTGLCALPDPQSALMVVTTPESAGISAAATKSIIDLQKDMLEKAEAAFRQAVASAGPGNDASFLHQVGTAEYSAASAATLAEAIVFPKSAASSGEPLSIAFDHVLMDERLPLILSGAPVYNPGPVIIGWDGSSGAARAVRMHAALIGAASEVIIAQNREDAERDGARPNVSPAALEQWLGYRNIKSRVEPIDGEVSGALLALKAKTGATLMVAGAYGHSRLGERLFGGTSRRLLAADDAPALALAR